MIFISNLPRSANCFAISWYLEGFQSHLYRNQFRNPSTHPAVSIGMLWPPLRPQKMDSKDPQWSPVKAVSSSQQPIQACQDDQPGTRFSQITFFSLLKNRLEYIRTCSSEFWWKKSATSVPAISPVYLFSFHRLSSIAGNLSLIFSLANFVTVVSFWAMNFSV